MAMALTRRWLTEYDVGSDTYAGPIILADSEPFAEGIMGCLRGPQGQTLRLMGELIFQAAGENGETKSTVRTWIES